MSTKAGYYNHRVKTNSDFGLIEVDLILVGRVTRTDFGMGGGIGT